jgi:hypothetical protein
MILTFAELGINAADYNGMHVSQAVPAIINIAANRITLSQYAHPHTNVEALYDWPATLIDFTNHTVEVIPSSYDVWIAIAL